MIRFLLRALIFLGSAALGLWITSLILDDFVIHSGGFFVAVVIFAVLQSILSPFFFKTTTRNASALTGAVGLISTFVALVVANLVSDGLSITGTSTWFIGTILVWIITMLGTLLLPLVILKKGAEERKATA
ncbi:hypothetical protein ACPPVS_01015 [Cellulomonas sp. McL0617]|uniref:hypothetical protein n=1 Tax=Cellulomonas sp. McL0617 TaxID=3415675 RepID=UPI003CF8475D